MLENKRSPFPYPNLTNDTLKERQEDLTYHSGDRKLFPIPSSNFTIFSCEDEGVNVSML